MLKNKNIICVSSIDWEFNWQAHQEIMSTLAKNGNRVLYIENTGIRVPNLKDVSRLKRRVLRWFRGVGGFREEMKNLYVYSPLILPFPYSRVASWLNMWLLIRPIKNWMKLMEFHDPIIWTFLPTLTALDIIRHIEKELLVYHCVADFDKLADDPKKVKRTEQFLIKQSDIIFVQGRVLEARCRQFNDNVHVFSGGVKIEGFENFNHGPDDIPRDIKDIKRPIIGYIGGVHKHIDFKLLKDIAEDHPEWSLVLVGPVQTDVSHISSLKNIFLLGKKIFSELPLYVNEFNVCIIPYDKSAYTDTVYPTKLNEYHASGKPVVSTALNEVINFNKENGDLVLISRTLKEFEDNICRTLNDTDCQMAQRRILSAKKNDWTSKIEGMSAVIEEAIYKKFTASHDWRDNLRKFYKLGRKKVLGASILALCAYLLIFYTPLVWFLARPLKILEAPQKADAIVVFAGGVGESGQAAQGYEERVQTAVELYKKGYARHMIFSSGYMHVFKEPIIMKALAVTLGVPQEAIILEDKAKNTYENVKFTNEILKAHSWTSILLISSPYHMRRVSFVIDKAAPEIMVVYVPVSKSGFYSHESVVDGKRIWRRVTPRQIKGIIHEYLGILYYFVKGYI